MQEITNKWGMTFKVGQTVKITRRYSSLNERVKITKLSTRFIYAMDLKFCVNSRTSGNLYYLEAIK